MAKRNLTLYFTIAVCFLSYCPLALAETKYPPTVEEQSIKSTLPVHFGKSNRCSAVRVSEDLILSAAHCLLGYSGKSKRQDIIYSKINGVSYELKVLEIGRFAPPKGKMEDWILLTPKKVKSFPSSITIARFPDKQEIEHILKNLGDFGGKFKGVPIWAITYPSSSVVRVFPRPGFDGKGPFVSRGYLKSDAAYKKYILVMSNGLQFCDEENDPPYPRFDIDVDSEWDKLGQNSLIKRIYNVYYNYENDGDPLLYHTADYSNGSSGGGLFVEKSGNYLGMIPHGSSIKPRDTVFNGVGQLYRIDVVCRQSKILSRLEKCQRLIQ